MKTIINLLSQVTSNWIKKIKSPYARSHFRAAHNFIFIGNPEPNWKEAKYHLMQGWHLLQGKVR